MADPLAESRGGFRRSSCYATDSSLSQELQGFTIMAARLETAGSRHYALSSCPRLPQRSSASLDSPLSRNCSRRQARMSSWPSSPARPSVVSRRQRAPAYTQRAEAGASPCPRIGRVVLVERCRASLCRGLPLSHQGAGARVEETGAPTLLLVSSRALPAPPRACEASHPLQRVARRIPWEEKQRGRRLLPQFRGMSLHSPRGAHPRRIHRRRLRRGDEFLRGRRECAARFADLTILASFLPGLHHENATRLIESRGTRQGDSEFRGQHLRSSPQLRQRLVVAALLIKVPR